MDKISWSRLLSFCSTIFITQTLIYAQFRGGDHGYFGPEEDHHYYEEPSSRQAQKAVNPCHPSYHRFIKNEAQRSYNYRLGSEKREKVLCDRDLVPGWYRFHSLAGDTIPTSCPGVNYCGTRAPVWMKGTLPTVDEGIVKVAGCVSVQGKCCTTQIPMLVRNCSDFIVYHLQPTPACPSAYCAGYEVKCPPGLSSDTGFTPCHFPVDLLETKVSFGMSKDQSQLQFFCDVTLGGHVVPESVALEVEWLADDEIIQSETFGLLQQHKGVLKEDKWSVGQTLQCRARARHTSINTFTSVITSPTFSTGIVINSPASLTINEGGDPGYIEIQTNIPITCPPKKKKKSKNKKNNDKKEEEEEEEEKEEEGCCIQLEISTRGINTPRCADGSQFDLVVLNSCSYKICGDEWNTTHKIPVWAVNDGLIGVEGEGEPSKVLIDIRTVEPSPPRWQEISLPSQEIIVNNGDVPEKCLTDEETMTFDGLKYLNRLEGIFVLYRHETLPYEVQVQFKKCTQRAICNCAIAVRFGDVMLAADVCSTGKLKFWTHTSDGNFVEANKISHLPQIVRIDEGRSFQIQFPSGTRVNFGPNLRFIQIQASLPDFEHTSGLCGSFDRNPSNDLVTYKGQDICSVGSNKTESCEDFSKTYRLLPEQSLFSGTFNNDGIESDGDESTGPGHCSCSGLERNKATELRPKQKSKFSSYPYEEFQPEEGNEEENENEKNKCSTTQCVDPRGMEVSQQLLDLLLDDDFSGDDESFSRVAEAVPIEPVFAGDSNQILAQQSTKKEWTDDEAEVFCLRMIEGVSTAKLCRDIAHINVDVHTKACKHDVLHTKSAIWSMDALEQLRWECRDQVYHNMSIWEPQLGRQHGTPPLGVLSSLCLNNCTGVGSCENGQCHCSSGFLGSDCSVNLNQGPRATHLNHKGVCDIRNKPCSEVLVWGDKFADHSSIKCHFDIYRTQNVKSVPVLSGTTTTNGRLLTYQSIICDVPELPIHDAKIASFYIPGEGIDKTRTLMRMYVSYGLHGPRSLGLDYTLYDSLCWNCEGPLSCVASPSQSCNVLQEPFGSGSDPFLQNHSPYNSHSGLNTFSPSSVPLQISPDTSFDIQQPFGHPPNFGQVPRQQDHLNQHIQPQITHLSSTPCSHHKEIGPCKDDVVRYFFDQESRKCKPFIYGGCQGNKNNFLSESSCISSCLSTGVEGTNRGILSSPSDQLENSDYSKLIDTSSLDPKCKFNSNARLCRDPDTISYYFDPLLNKCRPLVSCDNLNFSNKTNCETECVKK